MNGASDGARKHLCADAHSRWTRRIRPEDRLIALSARRFKNIVSSTRVLAAWALLDEHTMGRRIPAMNRDHAIDQRRKSAGARQLVIRRRAQHSQHIVEMPAPHGLDEREFVRE
ncbi:MAG TPA: hypothetical protein VMF12_11650, partial [Xanthobacteraceae bacterium]|nr:hypothetical protein [Xanthobacteraceae bacterium]